MNRSLIGITCTLLLASASAAHAQVLGTFSWQLQPFCNVVTVTVTQTGATYTVNGFDDQCGAPQRAPLVGLAAPNPDGTIGLGLQVVTVPGGQGLQIDARISLSTLSGSWNDSAGNAGTFVPNASTGGTTRPLPAVSPIPPPFTLRADGGFLAQSTGGVGTIPVEGAGSRMMWYPNKAAFRVGQVEGTAWNDANVGGLSVALGFNTRASGFVSTAFGASTTASSTASTAMGSQTTASAVTSTAMGDRTTASAPSSTAMGLLTIASGNHGTAMGFTTTASGQSSTAMGAGTLASGFNTTAMGRNSIAAADEAVAAGFNVTANGHGSVVLGSYAIARTVAPGTFLFGDRSTTTELVGSASNQFLVRAAGGTVIHSNAAMSIGVQLAPNGSQWLGFSDVRAKRDFRPLDGETVLAKLAGMAVQEWSYLAQDEGIRHVGPTAQDFHAAFGLGEDPLRIGTMDADGIALAAVKALEARTSALAAENRNLRDALAALHAELAEMKARR
jgi:hypothetical protein